MADQKIDTAAMLDAFCRRMDERDAEINAIFAVRNAQNGTSDIPCAFCCSDEETPVEDVQPGRRWYCSGWKETAYLICHGCWERQARSDKERCGERDG